ncbi:hypothetical protein [Sphingomonas sp. SORGH_AS_0438]|uniref:hypothetical protein n=1 Tax=Sphingomonas sp. SORGH_AS_0438 TaxID=3041756 RepID=UPI0028577D86|nr:hypothetical protein [Sphingomonas sp. SORGH_AS_0438]MDR6128034.1 hypothetical protein [Sphingomonas sp. SORGH_AS_0438]
MLATLADLLTMILAGLALLVGAWAAMAGSIRAATAGYGDDPHVTAIQLRAGIALVLVGVVIFYVGAVYSTRIVIG